MISLVDTLVLAILSAVTICVRTGYKPVQGDGILPRDFTDILRGVAILMIVIHHIDNKACGGSYIFNAWGGVGVSLFLILSGFGINESFAKNGLRHYWKKKFSRVILPWFIFITIYFISGAVIVDNRWCRFDR